jgi:hypothetical protein
MIDTRPDPRTQARRRPRRYTPAVACLLIVATVGACSSSTAGPSHTTTGQAPVGTVVSGAVHASAATEITTSYIRFFDSTLAQAQRLPLLQHGAAFAQAMTEQANGEFAKATSVRVTIVTVTSPDQASVIYTLLLDGSPASTDQIGYAVREAGKWKVAGTTFCRLLAQQGAPPSVCERPPATSLPG